MALKHQRIRGNERLSYSEWCKRYQDRSDPLNHGLLFSLPMFEGAGSATVLDVARPHHPVTQVHAPVWTRLSSGLWVLDFDGANDLLSCAAESSTDLDFTSGDFSMVVWLYPHGLGGNGRFLNKGAGGQSGWGWRITESATVFYTSQAGATQSSADSGIAANTWTLRGISRVGASIRIYAAGVDATATAGTHINPTSAAAHPLEIGARTVGTDYFFDGLLWNPRIWARSLSAAEHRMMFERERGLFGV